ncbi:hypothetical protein MASR2M48_08370 [Spirochaetota bacterium]
MGGEVFEVNTDKQLLELLFLNRVDAIIGLENMIDAKNHGLPSSQRVLVEKIEPAVISTPYYLAFSNKYYSENPDIAWLIWNTIYLLKKNGELDSLYEKYADKDY